MKAMIIMGLLVMLAGNAMAFEFNSSDLPMDFTLDFDHNGSVSYIGFVSGPTNVSGPFLVNVSLPDLEPGNYTSEIVFGNGSERIYFNILNDLTEDDFQVQTDREVYFVNDTVFISSYAPKGTMVYLNISNGNLSRIFSTEVDESSAFAFVPDIAGVYSIHAVFNNSGWIIEKDTTFEVKIRISCRIDGPTEIEENGTAQFTALVTGGEGTVYYYWTYEDGKTDGIQTSSHRFEYIGDEKILVRVQDSRNEEAFCEQFIEVAEKTIELEIVVRDIETDKSLGDASVTISGNKEKTNVNGKAFFSDITADRHKISVRRNGYEPFSDRIEFDDDHRLLINLTPRLPETEKYPVVNIADLVDNVTVEDHLTVSFQVQSDDDITICRLLANLEGTLGYRIVDDLKQVEAGRLVELGGKLATGKHKIKVSCENKYGSSDSRSYSIEFIDNSIDTVEETPDPDSPTENTQPVTKTETPGVPADYTATYDKIRKAQSDFSRMTRDQAEIVQLFAYENLLKDMESQVRNVMQKRKDLDALQISESSYRSKKVEFDAELSKLSNLAPVAVTILERKNTIEEVTLEESIETIETYASARDIDDVDSEWLGEKSNQIQKDISTLSKALHVEILMASGAKQQYTIIMKEFQTDVNMTGGFIAEVVPKSFAESIRDITCKGNYEVIKEDPVFKPNIINNKIVYYVRGIKPMEETVKVRSVYILDPNHPQNLITGFFLFNGKGGSIFSTLLITLFVVAVLGTVTYSQRGQLMRLIPAPRKSSIINLMNNAMDNIKAGDNDGAIRLYPKILKSFARTQGIQRQELLPMVQYLAAVADTQYCTRLIQKAMHQMLEGDFESGGNLQDEIAETYEKMSKDCQKNMNAVYSKYAEMLRLKMLRQNNKIQQMANRKENIDDRLYTT